MGCADGLKELLGEEKDAEGHYLDVRCLATMIQRNLSIKTTQTKLLDIRAMILIKFMEHKTLDMMSRLFTKE